MSIISHLTARWRMALLLGAMGVLLVLIVSAVLFSSSRITALQERLTDVGLESFQLADHFQNAVLGLNNVMLRFESRGDTNYWQQFNALSSDLNDWLDLQKPQATSARERTLLVQMDDAFDEYLGVAHQMMTNRVHAAQSGDRTVREIARFEAEAQRLLGLGSQLAEAHRESRSRFVAESNRGLRLLRWVVVGALGCLAGLALWLALLVYRDLIAPLELKLIAAEALAERHGKLASLGVLASGVAHEIRNPLTAIKARVFTLRRRLAEGTAEHNAAEVIDGEINRLERIVQDFLRFARPADPQRIEVAADQLLREVVAFLAPQVAPATLRMDAEGSVSAVVDADPEQIRQVLINLIQNAAEAVSSEGEITLRVRLATRPLGGHQTEVVILEVEDNGCGIPTENANRLFDPFFTTKSAGTGLGLSIAARIVEKHGGALQYQTQVGKGTVFGIVLPCPRKAPRS